MLQQIISNNKILLYSNLKTEPISLVSKIYSFDSLEQNNNAYIIVNV